MTYKIDIYIGSGKCSICGKKSDQLWGERKICQKCLMKEIDKQTKPPKR